MIEIKNLNKFYNKGKQNSVHVINDVSLTLPDTGLVCILGESGSGKTTLMNVIGGLDDFKSGSINAFDIKLTKSSIRKVEKLRNENYGYIFQNYYLLGEQTVYYNIMLSLDMYDISVEEKDERIKTALEAVGMLKYRKRLVSQLSGGQQQRVAIARALAKSPRVIFADEPTGNLDEANTMRIMSILKKISNQCLIVLVTHEKRIADFFADEIIEISDGKIVKQRIKSDKTTYNFSDDTNIYLQEFEKVSKDDDITKINYYYDTDKSKIELNIIYNNGKFYINSPQNISITFLTNDDEKKVIDSKKPELDLDNVDKDVKYDLARIDQSKKPKIGLRESIKIAKSNIKLLGKKQLFAIISLVIMSILLTITVQDIMTLYFIDVHSVVKSDSHYITVKVDKGSSINSTEFEILCDKFYKDAVFGKLDKDDVIVINTKNDIEYVYSGYLQVENLRATFSRYSCCLIDLLDENKLLYGRMPQAPNEIVVDKWVLENFLKQNKIIAATIPNIKFMLNSNLDIVKKDFDLKIVGICDSNEPNIYLDKFTYFGVVGWGNQMASLSALKKAYPGMYDNIELKTDEILLNESKNKVNSNSIKSNIYMEYKVVGNFTKDLPVQYVVADASYDEILYNMIFYANEFKVYTNDKVRVINYFNSLPEELTQKLQITVTDNYANEIDYYINQRSSKVNARIIVTVTIFMISMVILYFTMKSNALKNIHNIAVYRLLGISKSNIRSIYAIENIILTTYTSLLGVIATTCVMKFVASIQSLNITIVYPWYAMVGTIICLYIINTIIGIMPISSIIKMPPAQITAKYDM